MPKRKALSTAWKAAYDPPLYSCVIDTPESFEELVARYEARRLEIASCATSLSEFLSSERATPEPRGVAHAKA